MSSTTAVITVCPLCGSSQLREVLDIESIPVHVCVMESSREEAIQAPTGSLALRWCDGCSFLFNAAFESEKLDFHPGYEASLRHSKTFQRFIRAVADRLGSKYQLHDKDIVEIGCGDGFFLSLLAEQGANRCVGFDPSAPSTGRIETGRGSVQLIRDYYGIESAEVPCDFLCCLSVMEDLARPHEFVSEVTEVLGTRRVPCYFEIFNGFGSVASGNHWSLLYEQCNYFNLSTYEALFQNCGFELLDSGFCYGNDEYIFVEALWDGTSPRRGIEPQCPTIPEHLETVAVRRENEILQWRSQLGSVADLGKSVILWGTGGKGVNFLNAIGPDSGIQYAVDINPRRQGLYVPGTAQEIVAPEQLCKIQPDYVVITNPLYEEEILEQLRILSVSCQCWLLR
ncbi:MAG: class I SAM-dependent methyltransferase [Planctomycetota bacterium]